MRGVPCLLLHLRMPQKTIALSYSKYVAKVLYLKTHYSPQFFHTHCIFHVVITVFCLLTLAISSRVWNHYVPHLILLRWNTDWGILALYRCLKCVTYRNGHSVFSICGLPALLPRQPVNSADSFMLHVQPWWPDLHISFCSHTVYLHVDDPTVTIPSNCLI
jgi:hypothetical protein